MRMKSYKNIDEYMDSFPGSVVEKLVKIRKLIKTIVPEAEEAISYGIPTFRLNGKNLVHFAAYENHIGFYPGAQAIEVFKKDIVKYNTGRGTIQFKLDKKSHTASSGK